MRIDPSTARGERIGESPLLSICIPCYKGAEFLPLVLDALLPQVEYFAPLVEVIVADDCSGDGTAEHVSARHAPFCKLVQNTVNVGMSRNILSSWRDHASGEYVWVFSQHNLIVPGGLKIILEALADNPEIDGFFLNFRCARFPEQWPEEAAGGYDGPYDYLGNADTASSGVPKWEQILSSQTALGTQTYAHIIRRSVAAKFWQGKNVGATFSTAIDTYTQTYTVAATMFGRPSYYIGAPILTMFNGAQTWSRLETRAVVYLKALPDLVDTYAKLGLRGDELLKAKQVAVLRAKDVLVEIFRARSPGLAPLVWRFIWRGPRGVRLRSSVWNAFVESGGSWPARAIRRTAAGNRRLRQYLLNCRPARFFRRHLIA